MGKLRISDGIDLHYGGIKEGGSNLTDGSRNITAGNVTITGNLAGKSDNTTEIGTYTTGAIKRIRMAQGGELHFGDTTTSSPLGITEGEWNNFGDQDRMSIYYRSSLKLFSGTSEKFAFDSSGNLNVTGNIITTSTSAVIQTPRISMEADGTLDWGSSRNYGTLTWDTNKAIIAGQVNSSLVFKTNNSGVALTLDTSQNATFAGIVSNGAIRASDLGSNSHNLSISGTSSPWSATNRATIHLDGVSSSLIGFRHGNANKGYIFATGSVMEFLSYGSIALLANASGSVYGKLSASGIWNVSGSYALGGTTVIDSSRNLTNIGTISASDDVTTSGSYTTFGGGASNYGVIRVTHPQGADRHSRSSSETGAIKITLPVSWTSTMLRFTVKIFEYVSGESFEVVCAGYNYGSGSTWVNTSAYIINQPNYDRDFTVSFGHDGTKCAVYIGTTSSTWTYPQITVTDFQAGFNAASASNWADGWDVELVTSLGTITSVINNTSITDNARRLKVGGTEVISTSRKILNLHGGMTLQQDGTYGSSYGMLSFSGTTNGHNRIFGGNNTNDGLYLCSATGRNVFVRSNGNSNTDITLGRDATYGGYSAIGFQYQNVANGSNRIFAKNDGSDGIFIAGATGHGVIFRTNGGNANTFAMTSGGNFQVNNTSILDQSRNLTNIGTISSGAISSSGTFTAATTMIVDASGNSDTRIEVGSGTSQNHYAYIDFIGDTTYSNYGLRIIRGNGGANTSSTIAHRGTGNLDIVTYEAANIRFKTDEATALTLDSSQNANFTGDVTTNGYLQHYDYLYSRQNLRVLNAAGNGWHDWATRGGGKFDLNINNIVSSGTISSGAITSSSRFSSTINGNNTTGGNIALGSNNDSSAKWFGITGRQYDSGTETEGYSLITGSASSGVNLVTIGGGLDEQNAATTVSIKASTNSTTRNGTEVVRVTTSGLDIRNKPLRITGTTVIDSSRNLTNIGNITATGTTTFNNLYVDNNTTNYIRLYTEAATSQIADTISDTTTDKSYIYFGAGTSSNDPGFIMHETSNSETNEGVLHLVPSDDNSTNDYVSIHGTNDPDCVRVHTSGLIETAGGYTLTLSSDSGTINLNDNTSVSGSITATGVFQGIGINRSNGTEVIELNDNTYTILRNPEGSNTLYMGDSGDSGNYYDNTHHNFRPAGGGTAWVRILSNGLNVQSGGVLISGTTVIDSSRNLTNIGTISSGVITATNSSNAVVAKYNASNYSALRYDGVDTVAGGDGVYKRAGSEKLRLKTSGVNVTGTMTASADVVAYSDERLKSNIQTLDGKKALQMRGVSFEKDGVQSSGVIAQEIEKIAPELVHTSDDEIKTKSVAYGNLVGYLIEAVKEQQEQISKLTDRINDLAKGE